MISRTDQLSQLMATSPSERIGVASPVRATTIGGTSLSLVSIDSLVDDFRFRKAGCRIIEVNRVGIHTIPREESAS